MCRNNIGGYIFGASEQPSVAGAQANRDAAAARAETLRPVFAETAGLSAHKAADVPDSRQIATPTGAPWSAKIVIRARERIGA
jgi:hypothetical protein